MDQSIELAKLRGRVAKMENQLQVKSEEIIKLHRKIRHYEDTNRKKNPREGEIGNNGIRGDEQNEQSFSVRKFAVAVK